MTIYTDLEFSVPLEKVFNLIFSIVQVIINAALFYYQSFVFNVIKLLKQFFEILVFVDQHISQLNLSEEMKGSWTTLFELQYTSATKVAGCLQEFFENNAIKFAECLSTMFTTLAKSIKYQIGSFGSGENAAKDFANLLTKGSTLIDSLIENNGNLIVISIGSIIFISLFSELIDWVINISAIFLGIVSILYILSLQLYFGWFILLLQVQIFSLLPRKTLLIAIAAMTFQRLK